MELKQKRLCNLPRSFTYKLNVGLPDSNASFSRVVPSLDGIRLSALALRPDKVLSRALFLPSLLSWEK